MTAVVFANFSYAYSGTEKVLDTIDATIEKGSFTVITGPSGAGKTTMCLAIAGAVPHYFGGSIAGAVLVNGMNTAERGMNDLAQYVGTVLEDYESQLVTMTVGEEVAFSLENQGMASSEIRTRVTEALALVGLSGLENREVTALSGGQRQRLVIAGVLAAQPDILVLDEPASALDPQGANELYALLGQINREQGITIIVVEHDLSRVLAYADQYILLSDGKVLQIGAAETVLRYMRDKETFCQAIPPLWQLKLAIEAETGVAFSNWQTEAEAVAELKSYLRHYRGGVSRSA